MGGRIGIRPIPCSQVIFDDRQIGDYSDKFDNWICFCSQKQLIELLTKASSGKKRWMLLSWIKSNPIPLCCNIYLPDTEYIVHSFVKNRLFGGYNEKSRYIIHPCRQNKPHPNQKPEAVIEKLVKLGSQEGELVMDLFAGSGTTGIVCKRLGRKCILVEKEEKYCEVAAKLLSEDLGI